jgi:hypothetical protein
MNKDIAMHIAPAPSLEAEDASEASSKKKTVIIKHKEAIGGGGFFET